MKGFFRNNMILAAIEIGGRIPLLFTLGYLASSVGPSVYGEWALVLAVVGVLTGLGVLGMSSSISRMASGASPDAAKGYLIYALRSSAVAVGVFGLILVVAHQPLGAALGIRPGDRWLLMAGGLLAFTGTVEVMFDAYNKARERIRLQAFLVCGRTGIEVVVVVFVFATNLLTTNPEDRLLLYAVLALALRSVLLYPWLFLASPRRVVIPDRTARSAFVRYGLPMIPAALLVWLTTQGDRLVLGHAVSRQELGWYAFGASLAWNVSYLTLAVYPLLLPRASVLHDSGEHDEVARLFAASQRVYLALFGGLAIALAVLSPDIVRATAGSSFAPAAPIFLLLSVSVGLDGLLGIFQWVFHLVRRTSLVLAFNLLYMALQVGCVFTVAMITGDINAVAWTVLLVVLVANVMRYAVARRVYILRLSKSTMFAIALVAAAVAAGAEFGQQLPLGLRLVVGLGAGAGGLGAAAWITGLRPSLHPFARAEVVGS
jgi:O-antigen/teichoic acid export membrane protein